ncbi:MAG: aspartyl protease family protein [Candidatus Yanofskybacteria bacterium]|nr:aspartyl protease family protein [Candidatus Yanofskybacteria bacterium]
MKFKYKKYGPGILRPVIPVEITYKDKDRAVPYEVLVDSGADFCIFDAQIAEVLGIDVLRGDKQEVWGITGVGEPYYVHDVTLKVGGWPYSVRVGFLPNIARMGYGVVGQKGFFDIFVVKFDFLKEEIELIPRK